MPILLGLKGDKPYRRRQQTLYVEGDKPYKRRQTLFGGKQMWYCNKPNNLHTLYKRRQPLKKVIHPIRRQTNPVRQQTLQGDKSYKATNPKKRQQALHVSPNPLRQQTL